MTLVLVLSVVTTARPVLLTLNLNFRVMPPRTRIAVECPGCGSAFRTETALRQHRAGWHNHNRACSLHHEQGAIVSTWVPGGPGGAGRLEVDLPALLGLNSRRSPSLEPGDDLNPPPDFNEDLLGGPENPAAPPVAPIQVQLT